MAKISFSKQNVLKESTIKGKFGFIMILNNNLKIFLKIWNTEVETQDSRANLSWTLGMFENYFWIVSNLQKR